jgi:predicted amidohydrolase YtcJ
MALAAGTPHPDLIVYNAKVYTVDDSQPTAQAFAVKNGRFIAVGSNQEILGYAGPSTRRLDAQSSTIVPGFNEAHIHADGQTLLYEVLVGNPFEVEFVTIDSIIEKLRKRAAETPPGHWVAGRFYDDTKVKDGRLITRQDLDKVSTVHPVSVRHRGGHTTFYNSKAFEMAGVTASTPNPPGGEFFHDASGLSGRVAEKANRVMQEAGKRVQYTPAQLVERARAGNAHFSKTLVRYGITSAQSSTGDPEDLQSLQKLRQDGELLHRVSFEVSGRLLESMITNRIRTGLGDDWVRLGATAEHVVDGSFSERTARLSNGYPGISPPYYGIMTETQDDLNAWAERVHRAGIQMNCHANGDMGIATTLTAYERALRLFPTPNARPKITHCSVMNDDLIRRIKAIDAVPATFTTYLYYNADKFHYYGKEIMDRTFAFREFVDAGITAAAGSDYGPGPFSPLMGIQGIVTRKGWDGSVWGARQKVTVAEAIKIHTANGAYATHEEGKKGTITPGKLADFVMLEKDPHTVDPESIIKIKILKTFTEGRAVYEA